MRDIVCKECQRTVGRGLEVRQDLRSHGEVQGREVHLGGRVIMSGELRDWMGRGEEVFESWGDMTERR